MLRRTLTRHALRSVSRHYPFYVGMGGLSQAKLFRDAVPAEPVTAHLRNGFSLWVQPNEHIGRTIYYFGDLDPKVTYVLRKLLEPDDTFVDIGANVGVLSIGVADRVGPLGRIHAFEPNPVCVDLLRRSARDNCLTNLTIHPVALSDCDGSTELHLNRENMGAASLSRTSDVDAGAIVVATRKAGAAVTAVADSHGQYVMKIDIEGHEGVVLTHCSGLLEHNPPKGLVFEYYPSLTALRDEGIFEMLFDLGFTVLGVPRSYRRPSLRLLSPNVPTPPAHDYLAVPRERLDWLSGRLVVTRADAAPS
jgi:FkbM family methyltransferase